MSEAGPSRKLAAILAADVAGYSRLMALDDSATVRALNESRAVFQQRIEQRGGQVIDMVGRRAGRVPPVEAIELIAAGDHVVMTVRGAGIGPPVDDDEDEARGQATVVYTLADGKIVRMHDYLHRAEALEAAGASSVAWD